MDTRLIDWLLTRDPAIARLTRKYLLDENPPYAEGGLISMFLDRFDPATGMWGGGVYGPKWISTFYTMRDLVSLETDPATPALQRGLDTLLENMWTPSVYVSGDVCVYAMLLDMLLYIRPNAPARRGIADFLLSTRLPDGGWNCRFRRSAHPASSIHTTLSTLEALSAYAAGEASARRAAAEEAARQGGEYLLNRRLLRRVTTGEPILPYIAEFHFPTRWKYDLLRALVYFASAGRPYDARMDEGMDILRKKFGRGYLLKGLTYAGRIHFSMETGRVGAMNTLRGLRVLRAYDGPLFREKLFGKVRLSDDAG